MSDSQTDLQSPVQFALSYALVQDEPSVTYNQGHQLPTIDRFPILDQQQAKRTFFAKFHKNCGPDEVCQAQLNVIPKLFDGDRELGKSPQGAYELELGTLSDNELILDIDVENLGEAAYEATLDISFSSSLSYIGLGVGSEVNAPNLVNSSYLSFDLGNPFKFRFESIAEEEVFERLENYPFPVELVVENSSPNQAPSSIFSSSNQAPSSIFFKFQSSTFVYFKNATNGRNNI